MPGENLVDKRTLKELSLDYYEVAISNFLISIYKLKAENIHKQISKDINPIYWIIGHCVTHLDSVFGFQCQGERLCDQEVMHYFRYGAKKEEIFEKKPMNFKELIEIFIQIYEKSLEYLNSISEEKYRQFPEANRDKFSESLLKAIQRVTLHITGHMGQITTIRRKLGNPVSQGFVAGISQKSRVEIYSKWKKWWEESKSSFS